jgi:hypothetical protein
LASKIPAIIKFLWWNGTQTGVAFISLFLCHELWIRRKALLYGSAASEFSFLSFLFSFSLIPQPGSDLSPERIRVREL